MLQVGAPRFELLDGGDESLSWNSAHGKPSSSCRATVMLKARISQAWSNATSPERRGIASLKGRASTSESTRGLVSGDGVRFSRSIPITPRPGR
ncbi:hypothetical protein PP1_001820 [Pseudonocardia sp. P1]